MKSQLLDSHHGTRRFMLVLDSGDEACKGILDFATRESITSASLLAIGGFDHATLGWYDMAAKQYQPIAVDQQCEAVSVLGDLSVGDDGTPLLHLHATVGLSDGSTRGGHLMHGRVRPTLEVTLVETSAELHRRKDAASGAALLDLGN